MLHSCTLDNYFSVQEGQVIQFGNLRLYEVQDLCEKLNLTERTVRQLISSGTIEGRKLAKKWYVTEESLINYFDKEALPGLEANSFFTCATFAWLLSKGSHEVVAKPYEWFKAVCEPDSSDGAFENEPAFIDMLLGLLEKLRDKEIIVDYRIDEETDTIVISLNPRFIRPFYGEKWWKDVGAKLDE